MTNGHVYDTDRVMYPRNYLSQLQRTVSEGIPVKGYFLWSLLDNYEWADGYEKRFGIIYVDFKTQNRTPNSAPNSTKRSSGPTASSSTDAETSKTAQYFAGRYDTTG